MLGLRRAYCVLAAWVHATPGNCNGRSSSTCKNLRRQTTTWHSAEASHGKVPVLVNHCPGKAISPPPCPGVRASLRCAGSRSFLLPGCTGNLYPVATWNWEFMCLRCYGRSAGSPANHNHPQRASPAGPLAPGGKDCLAKAASPCHCDYRPSRFQAFPP